MNWIKKLGLPVFIFLLGISCVSCESEKNDKNDDNAEIETNNTMENTTNLDILNNDLQLGKVKLKNLEWELGTIGANVFGMYEPSLTRFRTKQRYKILKGSTINFNEIEYELNFYDRYGKYLDSTGWLNMDYIFEEDCYCAILLKSNSSNALDISKFENACNLLTTDFYDIDIYFISLNTIGDCIVIRRKNSESAIMIDCGYSTDYSLIKNFLLLNNIKKFDWFIISHYHDDHTGNFDALLNDDSFDFSQCDFILPPDPAISYLETNEEVKNEFNKIKNTLESKEYTNIYKPNDLQFHEFFTNDNLVKLYNYNHDYYYENNLDYNNMSLCFEFIIGNVKILFVGDIAKDGQEQIKGDVSNINILKTSHHGFDVLNNFSIEFHDNLGAELFISSSPSGGFTEFYSNSGLVKYATINNIKNIMTGKTGDLKLSISKNGYAINGKSYYCSVTEEEFKTIKRINN